MTTTASGGGGSSGGGGGGTDWTGLVLAGLGSMFSNSTSQSNIKAENKDDYKWSSRLMEYKAALDDYYKLRDRQEYRNAAGEYGKFSSLDRWAPGYSQTYQPLQAPNAPPTFQSILGDGGDKYYDRYTGGTNPGIQGGAPAGSGNSLDPLGLRNNGIDGDYQAWRRSQGGQGGGG